MSSWSKPVSCELAVRAYKLMVKPVSYELALKAYKLVVKAYYSLFYLLYVVARRNGKIFIDFSIFWQQLTECEKEKIIAVQN